MALFKIFKGLKDNLPKTYKDGYCYLTTDDGKMYIDTKDSDSTGRIVLNAEKADKLATARTITIGNTGKSFNGTANLSYNLTEIGCANRHATTWDFSKSYSSGYDTFDVSKPNGGPVEDWINGFVSTHNNYLSSFLINVHRSADWYVGYSEHSVEGTSKMPVWSKLLHSTNYNQYAPTLTGAGASGTWGINISGNAVTATKATQDGDGKVISSTYLKLSGGTMTGHLCLNTASSISDTAGHYLLTFNNSGTSGATSGTAVGYQGNITTIRGTELKWYDGSNTYNILNTKNIITTAQGGTGVNSHTANRLVWSTSATTLSATNHYANTSKVGINYASEPSTTFYVNGTSTLGGATSINGNLTIQTNDSDKFITFSNGDGFTWRIGYLGSGSGDANYLAIQSDGPSAGTFSNALRFGVQTQDAAFSGNVYPLTNNAKNLGTSSNKWNTVYATTFSGTATTATKVYTTLSNPSSGTTYAIPFMASTSSGNQSLLTNNGIGFWTVEGTTSAVGTGELKLGNNAASGTAGNKRGMIYMYGQSSGYTEIIPSNNTTSNIQVYLPSKAGTIALTSDIAASNSATTTKLATARTLTIGNKGKTFDGSANVSWTMSEIGCLPTAGGTMTGKLTSNSLIQINTTISSNYTNNSPTQQPIIINGSLASGVSLTDKNAPGIGFHIGGTTWGNLALTTQGFKFLNNTRDGLMSVYASTFIGSLNGNASTATKLATARTIRTNLASTSTASFDGSANITPGVTGTLAIGNGGTGATTRINAIKNLGVFGLYSRDEIGTSPNFDNPGVNGYFELRSKSETTGETGTKPYDGYGPFISINYTNTMFQLAGTNANGFYIRGKQAANVTLAGVAWKRIWTQGDSVTGAVWNDYAECRESDDNEPGYVLIENGDDTLSKSTERLQQFAGISSDTWGFSQGETDKAKTHIAVAGRVLAHTYRDRNKYKPGDAVCTAPGGTVDIMTEEEIIRYPHRIVGTVSCVPEYEEWGGGEYADRDPVQVNGRIWIKVK